jgi:hypothetical protein
MRCKNDVLGAVVEVAIKSREVRGSGSLVATCNDIWPGVLVATELLN